MAPIYTLANLFPPALNFRGAAIISAVIGLLNHTVESLTYTQTHPRGEYAYTYGINRKAVIAGTPAAIVGAILAAVTYLLIMDCHAPFRAGDDEDIAVAPKH